LFFLANT